MTKINCPECNNCLIFLEDYVDLKGALVRKYKCNCGKTYERHTLYNSIGLVKYDGLYSSDYTRFW